ncbi:MAG: PAS domain-containing sensor histidine kinase [Alphaproteobacteria bacterium]
MTSIDIDHNTIFQNMPVPRLILEYREPGQYVALAANDQALKYFNHSAEQVVGYPIEDFMDHENARHFEQTFEVCLAKKRLVTVQALPGVPGNIRVYNFIVSPVMDAQGEKILYLDVLGQPDVSDQSILQRERDDAIMLLTSVFDVSEIGIVVSDYHGRIVRVNDAFIRIYGWTRDELINVEVASLVTPDERELARKNHNEFIANGVRSSGEMKIIRKDGSIANSLFTTATIELSQRRRFQVTTVMDITLRKQMEHSLRLAKDQADTANRAKSTFLANMSHELRTPLNAILGFSEMMENETFGPLGNEKYKEYLGDIRMSANLLLDIINEVLDMSKIEAGRLELDEHNVCVKDLIASVTRMMASKAFGSGLVIKENMDDNLRPLHADQRLLRQILINLVTNAVKFSEKGGTITLDARILEDGRLRIIVEDEGLGIPEDKIKQAMEPFGQVSDKADNSHQRGTGLGLPLAKAMVELHGGTLELESGLGEGTKVSVYFPEERVMQKAPQTATQ